MLSHLSPAGVKFILVGHNLTGDLQLCDDLGIQLPPDIEMMDTQTLAWAAWAPQQEAAAAKEAAAAAVAEATAATGAAAAEAMAATLAVGGGSAGQRAGAGKGGAAAAMTTKLEANGTSSSSSRGGRNSGSSRGRGRSQSGGGRGGHGRGDGGGADVAGPTNSSNSHQISLKLLLEQLGIKPARLHNAGGYRAGFAAIVSPPCLASCWCSPQADCDCGL